MAPLPALADAGPPFLTNDPGTPGDANWEINLAAAPTAMRTGSTWQLPQIDVNYGVGERIQLTYETTYVATNAGADAHDDGWSNAYAGVKWRFYDGGEDGWQWATFPQIETGASARAVRDGIATMGPRYLLPIEVAKRFGAVDVDVEYGRYFSKQGAAERFVGLVVGREINSRWQLDLEVYDDRANGAPPRETTVDFGGRYKFRPGIIGLFMLGRAVNGVPTDETRFMGYFGVQILLSDYGRRLQASQ